MRQLIAILLFLASLTTFAQQQEGIVKSRIRTKCPHHTIRRCIKLDVYDNDIPQAFDGITIAFLTDIHYASRFNDNDLKELGTLLKELNADVILLGGDYQEGCQYVDPLFTTIMQAHPRLGAFGVMGNNDYERCTDLIRSSMSQNGITTLENAIDSIAYNGSKIYIAGALNTFKRREETPCPTANLTSSDYVILLTHTPDYTEDIYCQNVDLALAGHLHGGQVTLFGIYAPVLPSHHGQRFRHGIRKTSYNLPVVCSNGIGTSRKAIRFCAAPEIHLIVLHSTSKQ